MRSSMGRLKPSIHELVETKGPSLVRVCKTCKSGPQLKLGVTCNGTFWADVAGKALAMSRRALLAAIELNCCLFVQKALRD